MDRTQTVTGEAMRWIGLGRDVLLYGDGGSGRSTTLDQVVRQATAAGTHVLTLRAFRVPGSAPLTPLLLHELGPTPDQAGPHSLAALAATFGEELEGRRNMIAVDDLDHMDTGTLVVIEHLLRRPECSLIATVADSSLQDDSPASWRHLAYRAPAEVTVRAFEEWEMAALLAEHLDAPTDLALTSAVLTRSAGHPGVALALVDAGRFSGAVERVDGVWHATSPLDDVPHEAVVNVLTRHLDPRQVDGLHLLAWTGPVPLADAERLVGTDVLAQLTARHRVTTLWEHGDELTAVVPPALAHGLLRQLTTSHIRRAEVRVREHFGPDYTPRPSSGIDPTVPRRLVGPITAMSTDHSTWAATTAGLVLDRLSVQRAARRAAWREIPRAGHAVALLDLLGSAAEHREVRDVFEATVRGPDDHPDDEVRLVEQVEQWTRWSREADDGLGALLTERLSPPPEATARLRSRRAVVERLQATIASGRPQEALDLLDSARADPQGIEEELDALRTDALLFSGRQDEALLWARSCLTEALSRLDPTSIGIHTATLAGLHIVGGHYVDAWGPMSVVLRLGLPGPFDWSMPLRTVALGAVVQARVGNLRFAHLLLRELDSRVPPSPLQDALHTWAQAEVRFAERDLDEGNRLLWEHALAAADAGNLTAAMICWVSSAATYDPGQLDLIEQHYDRDLLPLFDPLVVLHRALAAGPSPDVVAAIGDMRFVLGPSQAAATLRRVNELRATEGLEPLRAAQLGRLTGKDHMFDPLADGLGPDAEPLSERERQVALYARSGLSNREIAQRLFLSVRTVESHMHRVLRKLGLGSRTDLLTEWEPNRDSNGDRAEGRRSGS